MTGPSAAADLAAFARGIERIGAAFDQIAPIVPLAGRWEMIRLSGATAAAADDTAGVLRASAVAKADDRAETDRLLLAEWEAFQVGVERVFALLEQAMLQLRDAARAERAAKPGKAA